MTHYFISSNTATQALENPYLRKVLSRHDIYMPHEKSFLETIIPKVVNKTKSIIETKLKEAVSISLIIDIWDSKQMADFMGVCASLTYSDMSRKLIVIVLDRMQGDGHHNAENIAATIKKILQQYTFNYGKIKAIVCDEGSALVRLIKQILNLENDNEFELDDDLLVNLTDDNEALSVIDSIKNFNNDEELSEIVQEIKTLDNMVIDDSEVEIDINNNDNENEDGEYNLTGGHSLIEEFELLIGSNRYPRFSCANHKANLAIRKTIKCDKTFVNLIKKLNKFSTSSHMSVIQAQIFRIKKNRLRSENLTRWSSTFMLIFSYYKGYVKGIFNDDYKCPVSKSQLEFYLTLLMPSYKFSLYHQRNNSNIGHTVPSVELLIAKYEKLSKDPKKKQFCNNIIKNFKHKFKFELDSNIYAAATLLDIGKIKDWNNKSFADDLKLKALNCLPHFVLLKLFEIVILYY